MLEHFSDSRLGVPLLQILLSMDDEIYTEKYGISELMDWDSCSAIWDMRGWPLNDTRFLTNNSNEEKVSQGKVESAVRHPARGLLWSLSFESLLT